MPLTLKIKWFFLFYIYSRRDWYVEMVYNWRCNRRKILIRIFIIICRFPYFLPKSMASGLCPRVNTIDNFHSESPAAFLWVTELKNSVPLFTHVASTSLTTPSWNLFLITYLKCTVVCYHFVNLISQFFTCKYQMPLWPYDLWTETLQLKKFE